MRLLPGIIVFCISQAVLAQTYPSRPITSVVGFAPGGGTDTVSRIIGKTLGEQLGQQVLTENKPGAGGNIATDFVAKAPADGYTILLGNVGSLAVAPHLVPTLSYDPQRDLAPITMAVVFPNLIVIDESLTLASCWSAISLTMASPRPQPSEALPGAR